MIYHALGLMSGSSLDGLDLALVRLEERAGRWDHRWLATDCIPYSDEWTIKLAQARQLTVPDFLRLHTSYGHYLGRQVSGFLKQHARNLKVDFIGSHGHTVFHDPAQATTCQIGDGAAIAAETGIPVISDLRNMDVAFGGQGAPIVPLGEKLLFPGFKFWLNLGGIANLSYTDNGQWKACDLCACNQLLNALAAERGVPFDEGGRIAESGFVNQDLLQALNNQDYFQRPAPKSLDNGFSIDVLLPLLNQSPISLEDKLRTVVEHIVMQVVEAIKEYPGRAEMLVTGGGALNDFLIGLLENACEARMVRLSKPDIQTIQFKEALIMALLAALRWRGEPTVMPDVTGARKASIGGALWLP